LVILGLDLDLELDRNSDPHSSKSLNLDSHIPVIRNTASETREISMPLALPYLL
jgi:hypothetical protein